MNRLSLAMAVLCVLSSQAEAHFEQSALVLRARALGGAFVSRADDPSTVFVNPAGMVSPDARALYVEYGEPAIADAEEESRLALVAGIKAIRLGFGWYRFGGADDASGNLILAGAAWKLIEGTPGSFLSIGATVSAGEISNGPSCCGGEGATWSKVTGDAGVILKPLPVISLAYAVGNLLNEHLDVEAEHADRWSRVHRWGISYAWEERVVLSLEERFIPGKTTFHYGFSFRAAVPLELMAGFSDGHTAGGVRLVGRRFRAAIAFTSGEGREIAWTGSCEIPFRGAKKDGAD